MDNVFYEKKRGLYLNIPFCNSICSYCHYTKNISFGYKKVPDEYFKIFIEQLDKSLKKMENYVFESIYFGGGTPSLLNDEQCQLIVDLLDKYKVISQEKSIEIHPRYCNFDYVNNQFFNRYSIGVQSFNKKLKSKYFRGNYENIDVLNMIKNIRNKNNKVINIDIMLENTQKFEKEILMEEISYINKLKPDTVTFYPNTKGRGKERLEVLIESLEFIKKKLIGYRTLAKSKFIFIRENGTQSMYSKLEYEYLGDIIGIGHNSISYIDNKSYVTYYNEVDFKVKERDNKEDRKIISIMRGIYSGVPNILVRDFLPELYKEHFFYTVIDDIDVLDKHRHVSDEELIYIPEKEYIRFYKILVETKKERLAQIFLETIGYGDANYDTIDSIYNRKIDLSYVELQELKNLLIKENIEKINTPNICILVEGIDGSGKDTFVRYLVKELKKRFVYDENSRISIMGQPDSKLDCGIEAKNFIENLQYIGHKEDVKKILTRNRIESEKMIKKLPGIKILIRGLVTDIATFKRKFNTIETLGEGIIIRNWDYYIVVDVPSEIADYRIEKRGGIRTWREVKEELDYFRRFYLNYTNDIISKKEILKNNNIEVLKKKAKEMANEIYVQTIRRK